MARLVTRVANYFVRQKLVTAQIAAQSGKQLRRLGNECFTPAV